ncbi:MAG: CorA family divalent cation transporter [Clostridiaceae bacterium]
MGILIHSDFSIEYDRDWDKDIENLICYIMDKDENLKIEDNYVTNIHSDIVVKNKNNLFLRIPYFYKGCQMYIRAVIENNVLILDFQEDNFIEFLKEKVALFGNVNSHIILLQFFQYLTIVYTETLLKYEENLEDLFENAVYRDDINLKELLSIKKAVSIMKRNTTYYKSIFSYLEDEFDNLTLFNKVSFVLDNVLNFILNLEASIFSCIDIYSSVSSNKMNKTMQLLTIITVISLPATIITGIFGMNFEVMPLINLPIGFIISMSLLLFLIVVEIYIFKKKKYL